MSGSLQDQLKALGLAKKPDPTAKPTQQSKRPPPAKVKPLLADDESLSLAAAYAAKAKAERSEADAAARAAAEKARLKRLRKATAQRLIPSNAVNDSAADVPRHFEYGKKIRRLYVTPEQLQALNRGDLGIGQLDGRFYLLPSTVVETLLREAPEFVALSIDPTHGAASQEDDPRFAVPDDLHW